MNGRRTGMLLTLWAAMSCADASDEQGPSREIGGKADDVSVDNAACRDALVDRSDGDDRPRPADLAARTDPLAQFVLRPEGTCPTTAAEVVARLREHDTAGCEGDPRAGLRTMLVSETAQLTGKPGGFRTVTVRECGDRPAHNLMMSQLSPSADADSIPDDVEIMAFDEARGMFAFYTLTGGVWSFHDMSADLLAEDSRSRCAQCHGSGGPLMKELDAPWVHWEGDADTPGVQPIVDAHDDLGTRSDGIELERLVLTGNEAWIEQWTKDLLVASDVAPLLEPLFCDVELNVGTAARAATDPVRFFPAAALVDDAFDTGSFPLQVSINTAAYASVIAANGQRVVDGGTTLTRADGMPATDTFFGGAFVQRSRVSQQFVERLRQIGALDEDFILDVLAVDFTRPVFSPERCELLKFAPTIDEMVVESAPELAAAAVAERFVDRLGNCCAPHPEPGCTGAGVQSCVCADDDFCCTEEWDALCVNRVGDLGCAACPGREELFASPRVDLVDGLAAKVREGFIETLSAAAPDPASAAGQLLTNLQTPDDAAAHRQRVADFFAACNARDPNELAADVVRIVSQRRALARQAPVFEFAATLPTDDLVHDPAQRFDPVTCALVTP